MPPRSDIEAHECFMKFSDLPTPALSKEQETFHENPNPVDASPLQRGRRQILECARADIEVRIKIASKDPTDSSLESTAGVNLISMSIPTCCGLAGIWVVP